MFARTSVITSVTLLGACHPTATAPESPTRRASTEEISSERCIRYTGEPRDLTLLGTPRSDPPRCCESGYGFDPQLAAHSCGFVDYLGESEELACVHRFEDARGQLHELRITPVVGLEHEAAIALHQSGEFDEHHRAGPAPVLRDVWLSSTPARHWALLPGWPATRRLTWEQAACSAADMLPVLAAMADAPPQSDAETPLPRLELNGAATLDAAPDSLLAQLASAPASEPTALHPLPLRAAALIDAAMRAAARDDLQAFTAHFDERARFGLPDRRQLSGRPLLQDGGAEAMAALRRVAARLSGDLGLHCPKLDRRVTPAVRRGEALMWCVWASADRLDLLVFGLRGRIIDGEADGRIEYLGLFPEAPQGVVITPGEPPPPPIRTRPQIVCGDPHAVDYPGLCPEPELEDEGETEGDAPDDEPP